jgi:CHAT domain-containing protein
MESRAAGTAGVDDRLLARARLLRQQVSTGLERRLRTGAAAGTDAKLVALEEELRNAESEIRRLTPRYRELNATPILGVRELQPRLDDDTVLLAFAVGDHHSALWVVTRARLELRALPPRETLDRLARATHESVARSSEADSSSARALARTVLDPAGALKPRVLVIADGSLHYVPFAALPDARGGRLIDRHEVTVLPSVSTVRLLQQRTGRTASRSVALLADPVFRADDERIAGASKGARTAATDRAVTRAAERFGGLEQLARLPLTRREATRIASLAGTDAKVALDFDANLATARDGRLSGFRYVHFATHGFLNPWRPELSGLVLSLYDAQGRSRDGFLSALDAFNLDLSAEVVVLSGCRTALGKEVQGEGLVGLPQGFMYAGARRVVSSLWAVDDAATAALMARFYEGLLSPKPLRPAAALRAAQEWVRAQPHWRDPYYWAAFQLQGDWN